MKTKSEILLMESRMHGDMHVRFGGRPPKTYHREMVRRWGSSLLKEIMDLCGIQKDISSHSGRHTFSTTVALANGVSMESVAKMLGHSNTNITRHYAKVLDRTVISEMDKVAERFNYAI